jgi:phosphoribosyl 1,2-cyclic phosphate phosphodiesterase
MRLTLLGTGDAAGMPVYGCNCEACAVAKADLTLQRTSCSALLEVGDQRYLLDAGQLNLSSRYPAGALHGVLLTHFHPDHVQGLFHLRWGTGLQIPVYCPPDAEGCADLYKHPGILRFQPQSEFIPFMLGDLRVTPLPLKHSKRTFGYLLEKDGQRIAYLADTKGLPQQVADLLADRPLHCMVIDCSFVPGSDQQGHNNLDDVLDLRKHIAPRLTVLTHIGHDLDIWLRAHAYALPNNLVVGSDGQRVFPAG